MVIDNSEKNPCHAKIIDHALAQHHLGIVRDKHTESMVFRVSITQLAWLVAVEATRDLELEDVRLQTPLTDDTGKRLKSRIGLVPILRAGIVMVDPVLNLVPTAEVWHLGLYRDEATAEPVHYYSKLPENSPVDIALILDPMLATGGSACMACQSMNQWGVAKTKLVSIIAAPEGIARVNQEFPDTEIFACAIDDHLNEDRFIVPGLGDAGDRVFNTA